MLNLIIVKCLNSNCNLKMKLKCYVGIGIICLAILTIPVAFKANAQAATATSTLLVTATVLATCLITTTPMVFGNYTGLVAASTASVIPICTVSTPYTIGLDVGTAVNATATTRAMTGPGSATLLYGLFRNATYTQNWGFTVGTDTVAGIATGINQPITVYGRVPSGQYPPPGAYTDTITATLTY